MRRRRSWLWSAGSGGGAAAAGGTGRKVNSVDYGEGGWGGCDVGWRLSGFLKSFAWGGEKRTGNPHAPLHKLRERTPNPSFPWHWAHLFIAAFSPIGCRVSQHRRPLGLVLERQSSQAKDGFVESKKVSIVFRAELTAGDERAARLSPKTRTP